MFGFVKKGKTMNILAYATLITIGLLFTVPLIWLVLAAFDKEAVVALVFPKQFTLENFQSVLENTKNRCGFMNSFIVSLSQTFIVLVSSFMAAYPLSRYALKLGQKISTAILFLTSIPTTAIMIPVYQMFLAIDLVDSTIGVILFLSAITLPYGIWMMKNFLENVPVELEEAAWIDGASGFKTALHVIFPLMIPGIFTVATYTFILSWGNFFVPFVLLQTNSKLTASVNIYQYFGNHGLILYGELAAYSIIYMSPVFILYFFSQNYMSQGFSMGGANKG